MPHSISSSLWSGLIPVLTSPGAPSRLMRAVAGNVDAFTARARGPAGGLELQSAGLRDREMRLRYRLCRLAERSSRMILTGRLVVTAADRCGPLSGGMPRGFEHCEKPERQSREETYQCSD